MHLSFFFFRLGFSHLFSCSCFSFLWYLSLFLSYYFPVRTYFSRSSFYDRYPTLSVTKLSGKRYPQSYFRYLRRSATRNLRAFTLSRFSNITSRIVLPRGPPVFSFLSFFFFFFYNSPRNLPTTTINPRYLHFPFLFFLAFARRRPLFFFFLEKVNDSRSTRPIRRCSFRSWFTFHDREVVDRSYVSRACKETENTMRILPQRSSNHLIDTPRGSDERSSKMKIVKQKRGGNYYIIRSLTFHDHAARATSVNFESSRVSCQIGSDAIENWIRTELTGSVQSFTNVPLTTHRVYMYTQ